MNVNINIYIYRLYNQLSVDTFGWNVQSWEINYIKLLVYCLDKTNSVWMDWKLLDEFGYEQDLDIEPYTHPHTRWGLAKDQRLIHCQIWIDKARNSICGCLSEFLTLHRISHQHQQFKFDSDKAKMGIEPTRVHRFKMIWQQPFADKNMQVPQKYPPVRTSSFQDVGIIDCTISVDPILWLSSIMFSPNFWSPVSCSVGMHQFFVVFCWDFSVRLSHSLHFSVDGIHRGHCFNPIFFGGSKGQPVETFCGFCHDFSMTKIYKNHVFPYHIGWFRYNVPINSKQFPRVEVFFPPNLFVGCYFNDCSMGTNWLNLLILHFLSQLILHDSIMIPPLIWSHVEKILVTPPTCGESIEHGPVCKSKSCLSHIKMFKI